MSGAGATSARRPARRRPPADAAGAAATAQPRPDEQPTGLRFEIRDVLGIEHAEIDLRPGRVNRLLGRNGAGKTSAILAVLRALGDDSVQLEVRDGASFGTVTGPGVDMVVPASGRVRIAGDPPLAAADLGSVARLISGDGRKDPATRNRARLEAFLQLVRPELSDDAIAMLCERDPEMVAWLRERVRSGQVVDLLQAGDALRLELQRRAREAEGASLGWSGQVEAAGRQEAAARERLRELGAEEPEPSPRPEQLREQLEAELRTHTQLALQAEGRRRLERLRDEALATATVRPDVDESVAPEREALDTAQRAYGQAGVEDAAAAQDLQRLEQEIAVARARRADAARRLGEAGETAARAAAALRAAEQRATTALQRWHEQQAVLDVDIAGPTEADVEAAAQRVRAQRAALAVHEASLALRDAKADGAAAAEARRKAADRGAQLRAWSHAVQDRIADVLQRRGAAGWTVVDGWLAVSEDGVVRDYERRLSTGEQIAAALSLAADRFRGLVYLDPEWYSGLDLPHRQLLEELAAQRPDMILVTEEATDGDLAIAHGPQPQPQGARA